MTDLSGILPNLILAAPLFLAANGLAQTSIGTEEPPASNSVLLNTTLNVETGAIVLDQVVIKEDTVERQFAYQDLQKPELTAYQSSGSSTVLYTLPMPPGTELVEPDHDLGNPATAVVRRAAKNFLIDSAVNSALPDIADSGNGLVLRFNPPLVNGPGVDLLIGEMGAPIGAADPYCPNTFSPGGDRLTLLVDSGASLTIEPDDYQPQGSLGVMRLYGNEELREGAPITYLADLENYPALAGRIIDHLHLYTATVDLNDLGIEEGELVSQIRVGSDPLEMTIDGEVRRCLTADPAFVFGL